MKKERTATTPKYRAWKHNSARGQSTAARNVCAKQAQTPVAQAPSSTTYHDGERIGTGRREGDRRGVLRSHGGRGGKQVRGEREGLGSALLYEREDASSCGLCGKLCRAVMPFVADSERE